MKTHNCPSMDITKVNCNIFMCNLDENFLRLRVSTDKNNLLSLIFLGGNFETE